MGAFTNSAITEVGRVLLAEVQAGAVFTPTRLVIGSGSIPNGKTAQTMTDVVAVVKSLVINKKQRTPDGKVIFGSVYSNEDITTAFYFRELALYAKPVHLNEDGSVASEGAEVLYTYGNAGDKADYMPAYSTNTVVEKQIDIVTYVGNNTQVDLTVESGIYASKAELDAVADGAVKKTGDTMTGELQIVVAGGKTVILPDEACTYIQSYKDGDWAHRRTLMLRNMDYSPDLASAITLGVQDDGTWKEYAVLHTENQHLIDLAVIGARKNTAVLTTTPPETWEDVESLGGGEHEWVQTGPLEWEPDDTPDGMVRVVLSVFPGVGNTYFLRYIDGSANKTMYFGEMNRWTRVATTEDAVSKAGDTMTNNLAIAKNGSPRLVLRTLDINESAIFQMDVAGRASMQSTKDDNNFNAIYVSNVDADLEDALQFRARKNGVDTWHTIIHTGNMEALMGVAPATIE